MKLDQKKNIKRLVIYFFYDKDGIVDRYVPYMLNDLQKNCSEIFVVCNGELTQEGRDTFQKITQKILVRENRGFDVWAYKTAMESYGWEELAEFDEVVLMNHTIMGPVYPFADVFREMDARDVDFWGLNKYHKQNINPFHISYGYIPEHIQSHFIAVRQSMVKDRAFQKYWDNHVEINCYEDAIGKHEAIFTKYFGDMGFRWETYVNTDDLDGFSCYPILDCPVKLIRDYGCPVFKRRVFFHDYKSKLVQTTAGQGKELLAYLKENTDYDVSLIWENILRTNNMADIKENLNLNYILPSNVKISTERKRSAVLVMHIYYEDLVSYCLDYAKAMPDGSDLIITTDSKAAKKIIENEIQTQDLNFADIRIVEIENRGRDVSALLVAAAPYLQNYEYVCFVHDKKVKQLRWGCSGFDFSERCFRNVLGSKTYVENILATFDENPYMGLAFPPPPNHAEYFANVGHQWGPNFTIAKGVYDKLGLTVPMDEDKEPIAPLGTMFWFRTVALKKILEYQWQYQDYPEEPIPVDGTILHGIERIYPFVAQDAGYYSAWIMSSDYAVTEWTNEDYMLRTLALKAFRLYGSNMFDSLCRIMDYYIDNPDNRGGVGPNWKLAMKDSVRKKVPTCIWKIVKAVYRLFGGKNWLDETLC